jgi:photosystem II stability/assembly factor-like uncharacterized protein
MVLSPLILFNNNERAFLEVNIMKNIIIKLILLLPLISELVYAKQNLLDKDRNTEPAIASEKATSSFLIDADTQGEWTILVGARGHILYQHAGEDNWQQAKVPVRVNLTSVTMTENHGYWAIGHDSIILKAQSPEKWQESHKGSYLAEVAKQEVNQRLNVLKAAVNPDIDLFDTLEYMRDELEFSQQDGGGNSLFDIHMQESGNGLIVGASGWAFMTRDHGENWAFISPNLNNPDLLHLYSATSTPDGTLFIAGEAGLLFRSINGEQWQQLDIPYYGTILSAHTTNKKGEIYLLGMGGKLLHSIDNGEHWQQLQLPSQTILQGACTTHDDSILLTGLGGQIFIVRGDKITHIPFSGRQHLSTPICASDHYQVAGEGGVYTLDQSSISVD